MKIIDVPQEGKLGLTVTWPGRNGLIRRAWVSPANPKTPEQLAVRNRLAVRASNWGSLTEVQQDAWITAAAQVQTRPHLGQSGPMTGLLFFVMINANLDLAGEPTVTTPPARPTFDNNITQSLELTNPAGVPAIKLVCSGSSSAFNFVWAAAPQNPGTRRPINWNYLAQLPEVVGGKADITSLYTAKFGTVSAGMRIFIQSEQMLNGWKDNPKAYQGNIPASS